MILPKNIAILSLTIVLQCSALVFKETMRAPKLRVSALSFDQAKAVANFATSCSILVDKVLAIDNPPDNYINIKECQKEEGQETHDSNTVLLNQNKKMHFFTYDLMKALIRRRVNELYTMSKEDWMIEFLASALTFRKILPLISDGESLKWDYTAAKTQFDQTLYPNAEMLIGSSIPPEYICFFQFYAMHCDILLHCLEALPGPKGEIVKKLLEMASFGRTAENSFNFVVSSRLPAGMSPQAWYERYARTACKKDNGTAERESIEAKVTALQQISLVSASTSGHIEYLTLDDLPKAVKDLKIDRNALLRRKKQFLSLRNESPPVLRPSLSLFAKAIDDLANGNPKQFQESIELARNEYAKALELQKNIESFMDEVELRHIPVTQRLAPILEIINRYQEMKDNWSIIQNKQNDF